MVARLDFTHSLSPLYIYSVNPSYFPFTNPKLPSLSPLMPRPSPRLIRASLLPLLPLLTLTANRLPPLCPYFPFIPLFLPCWQVLPRPHDHAFVPLGSLVLVLHAILFLFLTFRLFSFLFLFFPLFLIFLFLMFLFTTCAWVYLVCDLALGHVVLVLLRLALFLLM